MGTINPTQSSPGDTIEASDVNTPVNQLAAVINGNIETVNIADNAVTTAKLAAGSVAPAKIDNNFIFRARRNTTFTPTANTWTKIPIDTEDFDPNSNFDTTNNRYTVPVTGYYQFNGRVSISNPGTNCIVSLYKNGSIFVRGAHTGGTGVVGVNISELVSATAADYFELWMFSTNANAIEFGADDTRPSFNGYFVTT